MWLVLAAAASIPIASQCLTGVRVAGEPLRECAAVSRFYSARENALAWRRDGAAMREAIAASADDGLAPARYHLPALDGANEEEKDVLLTDAFLALGEDLRTGRLRRTAAGAETAGALSRALESHDVEGALDALRPADPGYRALAVAFTRYREMSWEPLGRGAPLREGDAGPRVAALRARLHAEGDLTTDEGAAFDADLGEAVRSWQGRHGLDPDGVVGGATQRALDVPAAERARTIAVNLERLRWERGPAPDPRVEVNAAAFELRLVRDGETLLVSKIVVGRNEDGRRTPVLDSTIRAVVVAPEWEIPDSIAREEIEPRIAADPDFAVREGIGEIDGHFVQSPGPENPLGGVKLVFPNDNSVYLHDTPSRSLFERLERAASHGCVRVEKAFALAALLLDGAGWDEAELRAAAAAGTTTSIPLPRPVAVRIRYRTAWVDDAGLVQFRRDFYERDRALATAVSSGTTLSSPSSTPTKRPSDS